MGGAPVAFATRKDIAISSQFLVNQLNYWENNKIVGLKFERLKSDKNKGIWWMYSSDKNLFLVTNSLIDDGISFV
jgi:hypothetical protein